MSVSKKAPQALFWIRWSVPHFHRALFYVFFIGRCSMYFFIPLYVYPIHRRERRGEHLRKRTQFL